MSSIETWKLEVDTELQRQVGDSSWAAISAGDNVQLVQKLNMLEEGLRGLEPPRMIPPLEAHFGRDMTRVVARTVPVPPSVITPPGGGVQSSSFA